MRVIRPAAPVAPITPVAPRLAPENNGDPAAERRLVCEMLCLEHGARAVGPDDPRVAAPLPHAPWPVVQAGATTLHYRPALGVVFYTAGPGFDITRFVHRVAGLLADASADHLRGPRAVASSFATTARACARVPARPRAATSTNQYENARQLSLELRDDVAPDAQFLRQLTYCHAGHSNPDFTLGLDHSIFTGFTLNSIPVISRRAVFTWVFLPATVLLTGLSSHEASQRFDMTNTVNAVVAGLLYDEARLCRHPDGADLSTPMAADFDLCAAAPVAAVIPRPHPQDNRTPATLGNLLGFPRSRPDLSNGMRWRDEGTPPGALIIAGDRLHFVGNASRLNTISGRWPFRHARETLLAIDWCLLPDELSATPIRCLACDCPLGGEVIAVSGASGPNNWDARRHGRNLNEYDDVAFAPSVFYLCVFCWSATEGECIGAHLGAHVRRTTIPISPADACAASFAHVPLVPLLKGRAARVVAGVVRVVLPDGSTVVLTGHAWGAYPALGCAEIAAIGAPVVAGIQLVEWCGEL